MSASYFYGKSISIAEMCSMERKKCACLLRCLTDFLLLQFVTRHIWYLLVPSKSDFQEDYQLFLRISLSITVSNIEDMTQAAKKLALQKSMTKSRAYVVCRESLLIAYSNLD